SANTQKRGKTLYAILEIPKALRPRFGRARFVQSLGTDSIKTAQVVAAKIVADWKAEIAVAKGEPDNAALYRAALAKAKGQGDAELRRVMDEIELEAENVPAVSLAGYPGYNPTPSQVIAAEQDREER